MKTLLLKKRAIAAAVGIAGTFCVGSAGAAFQWSSFLGPDPENDGLMTNRAGATTVTFDAASLPTGVTYTGGAIVQGANGVHAPPAGDNSKYFTVGPSEGGNLGTFHHNGLLNYFGFNFSSPDLYNRIEFLRGATSLATFTGGQIDAFTNSGTTGNRGQSIYMHVDATSAADYFDTVKFYNVPSINAFETDNHAFIAVPEPETYAMLLAGLGLMGFIARRRKQALAS